jgi:hypothetical protein
MIRERTFTLAPTSISTFAVRERTPLQYLPHTCGGGAVEAHGLRVTEVQTRARSVGIERDYRLFAAIAFTVPNAVNRKTATYTNINAVLGKKKEDRGTTRTALQASIVTARRH